MKFNLTKAICALSCAVATTQVFADTNHDAKDVVNDVQLASVVKSLLKIAPSGTKADHLIFHDGFFTVTPERFLTALDVTRFTFKVTTKIAFIPITSDITLSMAGTLPTLDCNAPQITRVHVSGTNTLLDNEIRKYITEHANEIFTHNFIGQTNLVKYCKIKPKKPKIMEDESNSFNLVIE